RAHAFLRARSPCIVALFLPQEDVLELIHPRVGEQQRRIVGRNQRRAAHHAMPAGGKIVKELLAYFGPCHVYVYCLLPSSRVTNRSACPCFARPATFAAARSSPESRWHPAAAALSIRTWRPATAG